MCDGGRGGGWCCGALIVPVRTGFPVVSCKTGCIFAYIAIYLHTLLLLAVGSTQVYLSSSAAVIRAVRIRTPPSAPLIPHAEPQVDHQHRGGAGDWNTGIYLWELVTLYSKNTVIENESALVNAVISRVYSISIVRVRIYMNTLDNMNMISKCLLGRQVDVN